jgi:hypothetical protein
MDAATCRITFEKISYGCHGRVITSVESGISWSCYRGWLYFSLAYIVNGLRFAPPEYLNMNRDIKELFAR